MNAEKRMPRCPLQTLLEERLHSAKGLGWEMRDPHPFFQVNASGNATRKAPAWFRIACVVWRSLRLVRG